MRLVHSFFVAVPALLVWPGCGVRPPASRMAAATPSVSVHRVPPSSVPEPDDLLLVGRVRGYREWLGLTDSEPVPPILVWLQQKLAKESPILSDVDWDLPSEFVAVLNPIVVDAKTPSAPARGARLRRTLRRDTSVAVELAALEEKSEAEEKDGRNDDEPEEVPTEPAKSALDRLAVATSVPLRTYTPEVYPRLGYTAVGTGIFSKDDCLVSPPVAGDKARLICSDKLEIAKRLQAYLTRRLPREPLSNSPIFAELRLAPLRGAFAPIREELTAQLARLAASAGPTVVLAKGIASALLAETNSWVEATDALRFEAGPERSGEFRFAGRLLLNSTKPWLFQSYLTAARAVQLPPPAFFELPEEVKSFGFYFGLPEQRFEQLQVTLTALGQAALKEYGPASQVLSDSLDARRAKAFDTIVETWLNLAGAPCFRADHAVWGSGEKDVPIAMNAPKSIPAQDVLNAYVGFHVVATPTQSACPAALETLMGTVESGYGLLSKKDRAKFPIRVSRSTTERLSGDNELSIRRITVSKAALDALFSAEKSPLLQNEWGWRKPTQAAVFSILVARNVEHRGMDWFAFGFDEKELMRLLYRIAQREPASTRGRTGLAPPSQSTPINFSHVGLGYSSLIKAILPGEGETVRTVKKLLLNASLETSVHVSGSENAGEIALSYTLPKQTMDQLRTILHWDEAQFEELGKQIEKSASTAKVPLTGPVGAGTTSVHRR